MDERDRKLCQGDREKLRRRQDKSIFFSRDGGDCWKGRVVHGDGKWEMGADWSALPALRSRLEALLDA